MARVKLPKIPKITRKQAVAGTIGIAVIILLGVLIWVFVRMRSNTKAVVAPATITVTPATTTYMSDAQAAVWGPNYNILTTSKSLRAAVAAAQIMQPLMNLQLTPAQLATYQVPAVGDDVRKVITARVNTPQATLNQVEPL